VLAKIQRAVGIPVTTMFQHDHQPLHGTYPTSRWFAGELIREQYELTVPPNLEPGIYTIWIGLWNPLTHERLQSREHTKIQIGELHLRGH
jgi:hypothetical protein